MTGELRLDRPGPISVCRLLLLAFSSLFFLSQLQIRTVALQIEAIDSLPGPLVVQRKGRQLIALLGRQLVLQELSQRALGDLRQGIGTETSAERLPEFAATRQRRTGTLKVILA